METSSRVPVGEGLLVFVPPGREAAAVRRGAPGACVVTGAGAAPADVTSAPDARAVALARVVAPEGDARPGDLVVATELRGDDAPVALPGAALLAGALRRHGRRVHAGPVEDPGACRVAGAAAGRPLAVVHALADPDALAAAAAVLADWAAAVRPRHVLLAAPRAFCAGVERAVDTVEAALDEDAGPVHVRGQIVHNRHVVADLEERGARFVDEVDAVPPGGTLVLSAHGVAPAVRSRAHERGLRVIDATCPLVAKVHGEARRFARAGHTVLLVGHAGHSEVVGTLGEAPDRIVLVQDRDEAETVQVDDPRRVAWLSQTTLAVDETAEIVAVLRRRFPAIAGPRTDDICFATQNRQVAVAALSAECDLVLVVGSANSSNSRRLVEVAERHGCPARLVEDAGALDLAALAPAGRVGVTAGASAPERLVGGVVDALSALGPLTIAERRTTHESVSFRLPVMPPPGA